MRQENAHTGSTALLYSGDATGAAADYAYTKVFDTSAHPPTIDSNTTLSYWIYPQSANATCVALDMVFSDTTALRNLGAVDQNGKKLHPASQCGHLTLNQWNHVTANIGAVAAGKTPERIDLGYDQPGGNGTYRGYIDDISPTGRVTLKSRGRSGPLNHTGETVERPGPRSHDLLSPVGRSRLTRSAAWAGLS